MGLKRCTFGTSISGRTTHGFLMEPVSSKRRRKLKIINRIRQPKSHNIRNIIRKKYKN
jgi:hypothetical protein